MRIRNRADAVRTVGCVRQSIPALSSAESDVDRYAGFHRDNARNLPAAKGGLDQAVRAVTEHRDVIDEVDGGVVRAVIATGADVIFPS